MSDVSLMKETSNKKRHKTRKKKWKKSNKIDVKKKKRQKRKKSLIEARPFYEGLFEKMIVRIICSLFDARPFPFFDAWLRYFSQIVEYLRSWCRCKSL